MNFVRAFFELNRDIILFVYGLVFFILGTAIALQSRRYSRLDLSLEASGDLKHHLIEDVGIAFGAAVADFTPATCARYGHRVVPMDDALVEAALDLGGRPFYRGPVPSSLYDHWFRSFADNARATVHVRVLRGEDRHHVVEAAFKALGMALHDALVDSGVVFSTKGAVQW